MPSYTVQQSLKAKALRIKIYSDGRVVVTRPPRASEKDVQRFLDAHTMWIENTLLKFTARVERQKKKSIVPIALSNPRRGSRAYKEAVKITRVLTKERLTHFNQSYRFKYGTIAIRNQKTRWGSCSHKNNLSFNYRLTFLPPAVADYIIVHELCHTKEHNHSPRFWALVERAIPNHKALRRLLRNYQP